MDRGLLLVFKNNKKRRVRKADGGDISGAPVVNKPFGELTPGPAPSPTQWVGNKFQDAMQYLGASPYTARHLREGVGGILGLSPFGIAGSAADAIDANVRGDKMGTVQAMAGMIPGAGKMVSSVKNEVHAAADAFRDMLRSRGESVGEVNHSVNRYGDSSSYFDGLGGRIRISDHDANPTYRVNEIPVYYQHATEDYADQLVNGFREARKLDAEQRAATAAARDAYEAPFIERFRSASKDHEREKIMREAYPNLFSPGSGKQQRGPVLERFRGN